MLFWINLKSKYVLELFWFPNLYV